MERRPLRIAIADDEPDMREYLARVLKSLGHDVVVTAENGVELVAMCREAKPELVITDIMMPEKDGIEAANEICKEQTVPVIIISGYNDTELVSRAQFQELMAYLVKPIKKTDIEPAIAVAMRRFTEFERLRREAADLRQSLADRKIIERAKGILMRKTMLDEQGAFHRLQKLASEKNRKLVDIAQVILTAEEAFEPAS